MSTSEKYPGQNVLISYLKKKGSKSSYNGFIHEIHEDTFTTLISSADTCDNLNDTWIFHFLKEAELLLDEETFMIVYAENLRCERKWQIFWQRVIKEYKKENLVPATTESLCTTTTGSSCPKKTIAKQKEKLKRIRDNDTDDLSSEHWKKQCIIIKQNRDNLMYRKAIDNILQVISAHERKCYTFY
ncbi:hypothetical protein RclHR1_18710003 [Rhizophagus clarus]|uniref:Uncharacterized protein n=1 Tax=Rhizophagus clarus TaxID=94130 RepID=A0A2Z6RG43_9GLOM|nr:hypothetical protein RclHR1_18710003 [Rhizophagus clarus]